MKVEETLLVMGLLGTLCHSSKLLKVPRVYNAFVMSNEKLQPSQAYPILAPVIQGVAPRYVSSNVYRMHVVPSSSSSSSSSSQVQYSDTRSYSYSVSNTVREDYYQYNVVETGLPFQFELPTIAMIGAKNPEEPILFRSTVPLSDGNANSLTVSDGNAEEVDGERFVRLESSPDFHEDPRPWGSNVNDFRLQRAHRFEGINVPDVSENAGIPIKIKTPKPSSTYNHHVEIDDAVKNNRPEDRSIVDVPPPPIPIRRKSHGEKPGTTRREEYPPPAVGFL